MVSANLWTNWTKIAVEHERAAWVIRREALEFAQELRLPFMVREFPEALQAVTSAAFALDGRFGAVYPVLNGGNPRPGHAMGQGSLLDSVRKASSDPAVHAQAFDDETDWVFRKHDGARGRAVHHEPRAADGKAHPFMAGPMMAEYADYTADTASQAVQILRVLFFACRDFPKPPLARWSKSSRHMLDKFIDAIDGVDRTGQ